MDQDTGLPVRGAGEPIAAQPSAAPVSETAVPLEAGYSTGIPAQAFQVAPAQAPAAEVPSGTFATVVGYANIGIGLIVVIALGIYIAGFGIWITHLRVTHRDEGIEWMERSVSTLFWVIVILGILRFIQYNTALALQILSVAVVLFGGWLVIKAVQASGSGEDEH